VQNNVEHKHEIFQVISLSKTHQLNFYTPLTFNDTNSVRNNLQSN